MDHRDQPVNPSHSGFIASPRPGEISTATTTQPPTAKKHLSCWIKVIGFLRSMGALSISWGPRQRLGLQSNLLKEICAVAAYKQTTTFPGSRMAPRHSPHEIPPSRAIHSTYAMIASESVMSANSAVMPGAVFLPSRCTTCPHALHRANNRALSSLLPDRHLQLSFPAAAFPELHEGTAAAQVHFESAALALFSSSARPRRLAPTRLMLHFISSFQAEVILSVSGPSCTAPSTFKRCRSRSNRACVTPGCSPVTLRLTMLRSLRPGPRSNGIPKLSTSVCERALERYSELSHQWNRSGSRCTSNGLIDVPGGSLREVEAALKIVRLSLRRDARRKRVHHGIS